MGSSLYSFLELLLQGGEEEVLEDLNNAVTGLLQPAVMESLPRSLVLMEIDPAALKERLWLGEAGGRGAVGEEIQHALMGQILCGLVTRENQTLVPMVAALNHVHGTHGYAAMDQLLYSTETSPLPHAHRVNQSATSVIAERNNLQPLDSDTTALYNYLPFLLIVYIKNDI